MKFEPEMISLRDGRRVLVRAGVSGDVPAFRVFVLGLAVSSDQIITQRDEVMDVEGIRARLEASDHERGWLWLLATPEGSSGEVVGNCVLFPEAKRKLAHNAMFGMGVSGGWRGAGLGRALMERALAWAWAHPRLERIELDVFATNTAGVRLYESLGFDREGVLRGRVRQPDGSYVDVFRMALRVAD